jgi:DNA-binding response OmpR family regulator
MSQIPRVLIVEGTQARATSLTFLLGAAGYAVETASDGVTALEAAQVFHPDICLVNVNVPKLNGYDLARRLRTELEFPPLFANVTPFCERDDWEADAQFDLDFSKPSDPCVIVEQLSNFLRNELPEARTKVQAAPLSRSRGRSP